VTNSKGEKVEVYWNSMVWEEMSMVYTGNNPTDEIVEHPWEIFLWGEYGIHPLVDFDLSVPKSWFEYEEENYGEQRIIKD
jgi:hypothetical protein